jgi:hypothetical protein
MITLGKQRVVSSWLQQVGKSASSSQVYNDRQKTHVSLKVEASFSQDDPCPALLAQSAHPMSSAHHLCFRKCDHFHTLESNILLLPVFLASFVHHSLVCAVPPYPLFCPVISCYHLCSFRHFLGLKF